MDYRNEVVLAGHLRKESQQFGNGPVRMLVAPQDKAFPAYNVNVWGDLRDDLNGLPKGTQVKVKGQLSSQKLYPPLKNAGGYDVYETIVNVDAAHGGKVQVLSAPKPEPQQQPQDDDAPF